MAVDSCRDATIYLPTVSPRLSSLLVTLSVLVPFLSPHRKNMDAAGPPDNLQLGGQPSPVGMPRRSVPPTP
ncbi:hypothetical protein LZ32DRAFT_611740 [Colletotrichum eremochloae]|nr:hypothetical protein LZ32DRAFT_611740 [Colletotrichum eremochloae]